MQLTLEPNIPKLQKPVTYNDSLLLVGSCFSENMYERLKHAKFRVMSNPNGILFNPLSVAWSLDGYMDNRQYTRDDLFYLNELWNSWDHHTRFSHIDADATLAGINQSQNEAHAFIKSAGYVIITLGSAFQYHLKDNGKPVANNHRAPAQWFEKRLLPIDIIVAELSRTLDKLFALNPDVRVIFTISPVRHIRDGVVDNNRSKARLLEAVHTLRERYAPSYYFPAYEIVIDILRDYRYYDIDFVHPNYLATSYIWEQFVHACIDPGSLGLMKDLQELVTARNHRPRFPETEAHQKFKQAYLEKVNALIRQYPGINLTDELTYFTE